MHPQFFSVGELVSVWHWDSEKQESYEKHGMITRPMNSINAYAVMFENETIERYFHNGLIKRRY